MVIDFRSLVSHTCMCKCLGKSRPAIPVTLSSIGSTIRKAQTREPLKIREGCYLCPNMNMGFRSADPSGLAKSSPLQDSEEDAESSTGQG